MAEQTSQPVQVQAGNLVIEGAFDVSGKDIPEVKGFKVRVVYKDMEDMKKHALRSSVIFAQGKIRLAMRKGQPIPFAPGKMVTIDSNGNVSLTKEELDQRAVDRLLSNPEVLRNATSEQRRIIAEALGLALPAAVPLVDDEDAFQGYDEDELGKLPHARLRALAEKHEITGAEEMTKEELIEELTSL